MSFRRNWFTYLSLFLYMAAALLILIFGVTQFKEGKEYPLLSQMLLIVGIFGVFALINLLFYFLTRPGMVMVQDYIKKKCIWVEWLFVIGVLAAGIVFRIWYINTYSVGMESDYKFYYDVAKMIRNNTLLTQANNEYIALFPNTFGYSYVLSLVMRVFGTTPEVCLYFNVAISALTSFFCYRTGKNLAGSIGGITAFLFSWFWPSQIIFSNINGSEATFTCLLMGGVLLTVYVMKKYDGTGKASAAPIVLHFLLGIILSLASSIRPMSVIFFIALVLCLFTVKKKLQYRNINDLSLGNIFVSKGWLRAVVVIAGYLICTQVINGGISNAIQKDAAGSGAMGYSLMVGVNIESDGGYSEDLMNILNNSYKETQSATEANKVCMDIAKESVMSDPMGTLELFAKKYYLIWSNDDYATTTNIVTMNNQNILTPDRENLMYGAAVWNNVYYLFMVFLSLVGAVYLFKRDSNGLILPVFFIGAALLHILVEMQNRYHYYLLQNFSLLAAVGLGLLFQEYLQRVKEKAPEREFRLEAVPAAAALEPGAGIMGETEEPGIEQDLFQYDRLSGNILPQLDVLKAIEDGHIIITASEAYRDMENPGTDGNPEAGEKQNAAVNTGAAENLKLNEELKKPGNPEPDGNREPDQNPEPDEGTVTAGNSRRNETPGIIGSTVKKNTALNENRDINRKSHVNLNKTGNKKKQRKYSGIGKEKNVSERSSGSRAGVKEKPILKLLVSADGKIPVPGIFPKKSGQNGKTAARPEIAVTRTAGRRKHANKKTTILDLLKEQISYNKQKGSGRKAAVKAGKRLGGTGKGNYTNNNHKKSV